MSNLDELPDLAGDVSARAVPPPYDEVTHRVRARRGRTAAGALAATALVVGGLAVWQNLSPAASPRPAPPVTSSGPVDGSWRQVVDGTDSHPFVISGTDDGSVAVVWRALEQPLPTWALVVRDADGTVTGARLDEPLYLTPVPGGWIAASPTEALLVSTDGARTPLGPKSAARPARAGDVLVQTGESPVVYRPDDGSWADLPADAPQVAAYVTPDGHVLGCRRDLRRQRVEVWRDEQVVAHVPGDSCVMAGSGDTVAVEALGDSADGSIPVVTLVRSDDSGRSWHELVTPQHLDFTSLSIGTDGTTYVTGTDGRLVVTEPDGTQFVAGDDHGVGFATDDSVCALAYGQSKGPLSCSDDHGQTWTESPLPGLE